jgi:hypothetical protein
VLSSYRMTPKRRYRSVRPPGRPQPDRPLDTGAGDAMSLASGTRLGAYEILQSARGRRTATDIGLTTRS